MANFRPGPSFPRPPVFNERPGQRLYTPPHRNVPRHEFNDIRPLLPNTTNSPKPANSPITHASSASSSPSTRNQSTPSTSTTNTDASTKQNSAAAMENVSTTEVARSSSEVLTSTTDTKTSSKTDKKKSDDQLESTNSGGMKRIRSEANVQQQDNSFDSSMSSVQQQNNDKQPTKGGRCRLFIGNIPADFKREEFDVLFEKYGELVEFFVHPQRGFGFAKLSSRQLAEQAKQDLDGRILRGKALRVRFASQGATVKVKNLSANVSNELLKEAFEQYFGYVERAVVIVDDRGKSTGEGIVEFVKKPYAQKCLNDCTEQCFFLTSELKPVIVEPWDIKDDEDGLPEKSLVRNAAYAKEREIAPRFADMNSIEHTVGLKWKQLELQEKQLLDEVKRRMQYATEQVKIETDQLYLDHQSQVLREELLRRQEELRRIDELRLQELDRRPPMMPPMHQSNAYHNSFNMSTGPASSVFHQNQPLMSASQYNDFQANPMNLHQQSQSNAANMDAAYMTNQTTHPFGLVNSHQGGDDYNQPQQYRFDGKRQRY